MPGRAALHIAPNTLLKPTAPVKAMDPALQVHGFPQIGPWRRRGTSEYPSTQGLRKCGRNDRLRDAQPPPCPGKQEPAPGGVPPRWVLGWSRMWLAGFLSSNFVCSRVQGSPPGTTDADTPQGRRIVRAHPSPDATGSRREGDDGRQGAGPGPGHCAGRGWAGCALPEAACNPARPPACRSPRAPGDPFPVLHPREPSGRLSSLLPLRGRRTPWDTAQ